MNQTAKTTRARIKLAVWPDGSWVAYGDNTKNTERTMDELIDAAPGGESWSWIEFDIPLPATIEGNYYDAHKPYVVVEKADDVWTWLVLDPRWHTKLGCPTVVAEGSADTLVLAYERAKWAMSKVG